MSQLPAVQCVRGHKLVVLVHVSRVHLEGSALSKAGVVVRVLYGSAIVGFFFVPSPALGGFREAPPALRSLSSRSATEVSSCHRARGGGSAGSVLRL